MQESSRIRSQGLTAQWKGVSSEAARQGQNDAEALGRQSKALWGKRPQAFTSGSEGATLENDMDSLPPGAPSRLLQCPTRSVGRKCPGQLWPQIRNADNLSFSKTSSTTGPAAGHTSEHMPLLECMKRNSISHGRARLAAAASS